jgi:TolB protein
MKFFLVILFSIFQLNAFAQDAVIAVGQAEAEKDKLVIDDPELNPSLNGNQKALALELTELLRNNFLFYKHKFNSVDYKHKGQKSFSAPNMDQWRESGVSYFVASEMGPSGSGIQARLKAYSVLTGREIFSGAAQLTSDSLRSQGHQLADQVYRAITGKPSIFMAKIVFVSDRTSPKKDIQKELYIMDFDGRRVERLTNFNSMVISPDVSPDNSKIMFSVITPKKEVTREKVRFIKNIDLKMLDLKTRNISTISERPGINSGGIFSADGKMAYLTLSFSGNADIYELTFDSGRMRKITSHYAEDVDPSITRDGKLMTFLSNRAGKANIYTMDPSETEKDVKRISFVGKFNGTPRFSPDGKEIVFTSWVDATFDLYRIGSDGNNLVRLTKNFGSNEEPVFSPDAEFIVFTSKRVNKGVAVQDLYIMNREGEIIAQLTKDFGRCFSPKWSNVLN